MRSGGLRPAMPGVPVGPGRRSIVADRQALAALCPAPFHHQPAIFGAHPHEKAVRSLPMAGVGLERSFAFHYCSGNRARTSHFGPVDPHFDRRHRWKRGNEPTMLANGFGRCQRDGFVLESASFAGAQPRFKPMHVWSLPKVFHTCGKNCGNALTSKVSRTFLLRLRPGF